MASARGPNHPPQRWARACSQTQKLSTSETWPSPLGAVLCCSAPGGGTRMATMVIVHGAFGGGWGWREVAALLRARGHDVFTPSLTGFGERAHLATPETSLETHIQDILNLLR